MDFRVLRTGVPSGWEWIEWLLPLGLGAAALAVVILVARALGNVRARRGGLLDPLQLEELLLGTPPCIIDLRSAREFRGSHGHIRGSLNIPLEDLPRRLGELDARQLRPNGVVGGHEARARQAARLLRARGFSWLYVLRGGLHAWRRAGMLVMHSKAPEGRARH